MEAAGVDRRGELLRITLRPGGSVAAVTAALELIGFAAEVVADVAVTERWYGPSDVRELSREEALVVASRVTRAFGAAQQIDADLVTVASSAAAAAVYRWFVDRSEGASSVREITSCARSVEAATSAVLGADRARALGDAIEADLAGAIHG